jgi:hypothetical protein
MATPKFVALARAPEVGGLVRSRSFASRVRKVMAVGTHNFVDYNQPQEALKVGPAACLNGSKYQTKRTTWVRKSWWFAVAEWATLTPEARAAYRALVKARQNRARVQTQEWAAWEAANPNWYKQGIQPELLAVKAAEAAVAAAEAKYAVLT